MTFIIYITLVLALIIHTITYIIVVDIHNSFEKTTKHLLGCIIDFISIPCSCGFRSCHLLHRYLLLLSLYFPCGTHIIFILQKNKCILTNQVSRTFAFHLCLNERYRNRTYDPKNHFLLLCQTELNVDEFTLIDVHLKDVAWPKTFVTFDYNPSKRLSINF